MAYESYADLNNKFIELTHMRDTIELLPKFNQVEILRILTRHKEATINENKYGIHINLTDLSIVLINEIKKYVEYVKSQELQLDQTEKEKETFKNIYFVKGVKEATA